MEGTVPESPIDRVSPTILGERLRDARKSRSLTQQQVAEQLGVARTTVVAIEKGERRVQPLELAKFAELYGRQLYELIRPRSLEPLSVELRSGVGSRITRDAELEPIAYELERLCEDYLELERLNGVHPVQKALQEYKLLHDPDGAAEDAATQERGRLGLGDGPLPNLREVLENDAGLRIFYLVMPGPVAAMFGYTQELGGCVAVNRNHPPERRRMSLAHEYGHFVSEREESGVTFVTKRTIRVSPREHFANTFSYAFLMPESGLRRRVRDVTSSRGGKITVADLCTLAHMYLVSPEALSIRLESLRLLPLGTWDRLKQGGFKVRDAQQRLGLEPVTEQDSVLPWRYVCHAAEAFQREQISEGRLAKYLRVDRVTARAMVEGISDPERLNDKGDLQRIHLDLGRVIDPRN
jgi:Zn-dependent peptidase ImmA (M78 family)/transcriptional regulator with XRE-family HTH domain